MKTLREKASYKQTIYACYIGYITQAIINNLAPLLFITFQKSLGVSLDKISLLITINFCVQILVDFLAARYVDKIGYRKSIVIAHIASVIGLVGMGITPFLFENSFVSLVLFIAINAVGGGLIEVLVSPIVEAAPSKEKEKAMSILHSFYCFGHVGVVLISTVLFRILGMDRWYIVPMIWAVIPLFNVFSFLIVPINKITEIDEAIKPKEVLKMKIFWIFVLLMICAGASEQAMSQWASFFAESGLKVSKTMGDLLGPCAFALLMGFSRVFYGKFGDKIRLERFIFASGILCVVSYLITILSPIPILALAGCALCGLSVGIMWPGSFSIAAKECPKGGTFMWALLALAGDVGCASGPGVVGYVSALTGGNGLKSGLACAIIFPVILLVIMKRMSNLH